MTPQLPITIVGGGLAGLTLGIALRRCDVPVTVFEAGTYPRHRVCGEFICGGGIGVLHKLGLRDKFIAAGAVQARQAMFHSGARSYPVKTLPRAALCLSRHVMDELLADEFGRLGGCLHERKRGTRFGPGIVRSTGRRPNASQSKVKWIGLKAHALQAPLEADLEMHFIPHGYVGVCRLGGDKVNVCGLFAVRGAIPQLAERWPLFLRGPAGSVLNNRLAKADFLPDSFCAVSSLDLRPALATPTRECRVGDALSMIPPVTGNGMSMAFESASRAVDPLTAYSRREVTWDEARSQIARQCDHLFGPRLRWASLLQRLLMQRGTCEFLLPLAGRFDGLWRACFAGTR